VLLAHYAAIGVAVVSALGLVLPRWLTMGPTLLTTPRHLVVCVALFCAGGWGLGRDIALEDRLRREAARADRMARRAEDAQLLALRSHLDPHFLFNTLNAIAEWCVVDGAVAERAVLQLSRMLRTILVGVRQERWSLAQELQLCDTLCELHRLRDPALSMRRCEQDVGELSLPPLLLLPLIENAIKHGPSAGHRGEILFRVQGDGDRVRISISNPGAYRGPRPGSEGLPTLARRLELAYASARFRISGSGARTIAELDLPRQARSGA
jgi:LytS/YehU family sensor histidine kinase